MPEKPTEAQLAYEMRHAATFVCLRARVSLKDLAEQCSVPLETMQKFYCSGVDPSKPEAQRICTVLNEMILADEQETGQPWVQTYKELLTDLPEGFTPQESEFLGTRNHYEAGTMYREFEKEQK